MSRCSGGKLRELVCSFARAGKMNGQSETECFLKKAAKDFPVVRVGGLAGGYDAHISSDAILSAVA
jgi:hypothetical protein